MQAPTLDSIAKLEEQLTKRFDSKLLVNPDLNRSLVSFQANKRKSGFRWFKYKEGFSAGLVDYILAHLGIDSGTLLDPFAGSGAALFVASNVGLSSVGIELLPVGKEIINCRKHAMNGHSAEIKKALNRWIKTKPWTTKKPGQAFSHLRITNGAFPIETEVALGKYRAAINREENPEIQDILRFAVMCILEEISYTRKDGQYLRWDQRSGRRQGARPFDKGMIYSFDEAIERKLTQICSDMGEEQPTLFGDTKPKGDVDVLVGSCLDQLPQLDAGSIDCLITSPPYCNRYDYTRTYALELAFLGTDEDRIKELRQAMVTCTVENREKTDLDSRGNNPSLFAKAERAFQEQMLINSIIQYLEDRKAAKLLNNTGIPRMVRGYFREMSLVIFECARVLKPGAPLVMVNDNVRYEGAGVPVDLILSDIAEQAGFEIEKIWVLPVGKGNSSQQMGKHGRDELRKCVYIWRAPKGKRAKKQAPRLVVQQ